MEDKKKKCIYCKRVLSATTDNFKEEKKCKYGLSDVCVNCQNERRYCGVSNRQNEVSKKSGKYLSNMRDTIKGR